MHTQHVLSLLFLAAVPVLAQSPEATSAVGSASLIPAVSGLGLVGLEPIDASSFVGAGDSYKVNFEPGSVAVTPVLGAAAPHNMPLQFTLESIEQGGVSLVQVEAPVTPVQDVDDVIYSHAGGIVERYELRPEGVYQSFSFPVAPSGTGDLVVRGRLATELMPAQKDGGYLFSLPGIGGLEYGAVTGIDATGWAFPGEILIDGDLVELRLGADDVARATFPLVLDPLLGNTLIVDGSSADDGDVDVAYSVALNRSLVVWDRRISNTDSDILGYQVQNGGSVGTLRLIETGGGIARDPSVAHNPLTSRFLVVWVNAPSVFQDLDILGRAVASNGTLGPFIPIATTSANERDPDVGGERTDADDECLVTWEEDGTGIRVAQVRLQVGNEGVLNGGPVVSESADVRDPAISKTPDDNGVFLIVWEQDVGSLTKIRGRAISRNDQILSPVTSISDGGFTDILSDSKPDVDTTGDAFIVAYQERESLLVTTHDLEAVRFIYASGALFQDGQTSEFEADQDDDEIRPSVSFTGESVVIGFHDLNAGEYDPYLEVIDHYTLLEGIEVLLEGSAVNSTSIRLGSRWSGGSTSGLVLATWDQLQANFTGNVLAREYSNPSNTTDLGGGCGNVGEIYAPVSLAGHSNFRVHLRDSNPGAIAVLAVSPNGGNLPCGSCAIMLNLSQVQLFVRTVAADGDTSGVFPIPNGFNSSDFFMQWAVFSGGGCGLIGGFDLTDALQVDFTDL